MDPSDIALPGVEDRRLLSLPRQLVHHRSELGHLLNFPACPERSNVDDLVAAIRAQQQGSEAAYAQRLVPSSAMPCLTP